MAGGANSACPLPLTSPHFPGSKRKKRMEDNGGLELQSDSAHHCPLPTALERMITTHFQVPPSRLRASQLQKVLHLQLQKNVMLCLSPSSSASICHMSPPAPFLKPEWGKEEDCGSLPGQQSLTYCSFAHPKELCYLQHPVFPCNGDGTRSVAFLASAKLFCISFKISPFSQSLA